MDPLTLTDIKTAQDIVYSAMVPTAQYAWPLIGEEIGTEVWVKHENHTPTGAFKVRGGLTFMAWLAEHHPTVKGIITATRGNHGQSQAFAAGRHGIEATIIVPEGNSLEKNAAMRAFGAKVIIHGADYDQARLEAERLSEEQGLFLVPSFHPALLRGVATYGYELFTAVPDLDVVFVPIGAGSGICATIMARDALGLNTKIIGVVSEHAQTAKLSAEAGRVIETDSARTFADGIAVRVPVPSALDIYAAGTEKIVTVTEDDVAKAIRLYYTATHNIAEGAGAAPLAAAMRYRDSLKGQKVGVILCGGNIDTNWFLDVLNGQTPSV